MRKEGEFFHATEWIKYLVGKTLGIRLDRRPCLVFLRVVHDCPSTYAVPGASTFCFAMSKGVRYAVVPISYCLSLIHSAIVHSVVHPPLSVNRLNPSALVLHTPACTQGYPLMPRVLIVQRVSGTDQRDRPKGDCRYRRVMQLRLTE